MQVSAPDVRTALDVDPYTLTRLNLLLAAQLFAALVYGVIFDVTVANFRQFLIPFVWITVGVWAAWHIEPASRTATHELLGATVAGTYFLLVSYLSGLLGPASTPLESITGWSGIGVSWQHSLGWGPVVLYAGDWFSMALVPYQVIGYLALAYLIYAAVLDITKSATAGIVGLVPCPGCAAPLVAPLLAGAAGTSSAFVLLVAYTYEIATIFFVVAVALLYWRPAFQSLPIDVPER